MSSSHEKGWDGAYHRHPLKRLPWELGRPREVLVDLVESGRVRPCETLDLCCGAGTNPTYLAERGFNVTALDISDRAVELTIGRAHRAGININILIGDFVNLPYIDEMFNFVFDFGCFHHVEMGNRSAFINGVHRVLKSSGTYLMVCFSERNGRAWNNFSGEQIIELFSDHFEIESIDHVSSLEGDEVERYFYEVFMKKSYEKKTPSFV